MQAQQYSQALANHRSWLKTFHAESGFWVETSVASEKEQNAAMFNVQLKAWSLLYILRILHVQDSQSSI